MKRGAWCRAVVACGWLFLVHCHTAQAGSASFDIKQDEPDTGSSLRQKIGSSNVPLDKSYGQLNAASLQRVRESFPDLSAGDEPPFPEGSLRPLARALSQLRFKFQGVNHASLVAKVNAAGEVQAVTLKEADDDTLAELAMQMVARAKFKPARCSGSPCEMEFPLQVELRGASELLR